MVNSLEDFFHSFGIGKKRTELNSVQESEIHAIIETVFTPAFEKLCEEFNSYKDIEAEIDVKKKNSDAILEDIELKVTLLFQPKFRYKPKFTVVNGSIHVTAQYCIPDMYGECKEFKNTGFTKLLAEVNQDDLMDDVTSTFTKKVVLK